MPEKNAPILTVEDLHTQFATESGIIRAVDGVSFQVCSGETLGIVGESGSGKSVTAYSLLRLIQPPGKITGGRALFKGRDLLRLSEREMRSVRGRVIAMVFQEPMTSLDPLYTIGNHLMEAIRLHQGLKGREARKIAVQALHDVGIPEPDRRIDSYPYQLSGGMRQRVMIAIALSCNPELLIADEPTTALDVTVQARILALLKRLQESRKTTLLLITHNLGIVAQTCDRVIVMYRGRVVEMATVCDLFHDPIHPYTQGLLQSIPTLESLPKRRLPTSSWQPTIEQWERSGLAQMNEHHWVSEWLL